MGETQFKQLYLLGNASRIVGIKKFFEDRLGVAVHRVSTINHLRINRDVDVQTLQSNLPAFATAFGVALQGVGAGACRERGGELLELYCWMRNKLETLFRETLRGPLDEVGAQL